MLLVEFLLSLLACSQATLKSVDRAPILAILTPIDGASFDPAAPVEFCAQVDDGDALSDLQLVLSSNVLSSDTGGTLWASDGAPLTGCDGGNLGLSLILTAATQTLSLSAVDSLGQAARTEITVTPALNSAPGCDIATPTEGAAYRIGDAIPFQATARDDESDPALLTAVLASDVDGVLWEGAPDSSGDVSTGFLDLSGADHLLTLTVTDPRGAIDVCGVNVSVDPCLDADADGFTTCDSDCDDADPAAFPGGAEVEDGGDNDCNGIADDTTLLYDDDGDGWTEVEGDCDDADPRTYPDAVESWYDGTDQDCDGRDDDRDEDGYEFAEDCDDGDASRSPAATESWYDGVDQDCDGNDDDQDYDGYVRADDCDDTDADIHPGAAELWYSGVDDDCDGADDDQDSDGYTLADDCDDTDATQNPGASEVWYDGVDQDCDGNDDDRDLDGYAYTVDCDDVDAAIHPGQEEIWYDGVDQDCDGNDDDRDEDGYAYTDDCDDTRAEINPGEAEIWYDGTDQDCDGNDDDRDEDGSLYTADCDDTNDAIYPDAPERRNGGDDDCDALCDEGVIAAGELVITEILKDPTTTNDADGEWFEVYNASAVPIALCGWTIRDDGTDSHTMTTDVTVLPGDYAVFARSGSELLNDGVTADYVYAGFTLGNSDDEVVLENDGVVIDRVDYTTSFPNSSGYSLTLNPLSLDAVSNDTATQWCRASSYYGVYNRGTPGVANDGC